MGIEATDLTSEAAIRRSQENEKIAQRIEGLPDAEFIQQPELDGKVTDVIYAHFHEGEQYTRALEQIAQLQKKHPEDRFIENLALSLGKLRLPLMYKDIFPPTEEGHNARRDWERSLPGPITRRLDETLIGKSTLHQLISLPLITRKHLQKKEDFDDLYNKQEAFIEKYFATNEDGVVLYTTLPLEEKQVLAAEIVELLLETADRAVRIYENTQTDGSSQ